MGLCRLAYQGLDAAGHSLLRLNPRIRDWFDRLFRAPIEAITQFLINLFRRNEHLAIAEERLLPDEPALAEEITRNMADFLKNQYLPGAYQRAGNTKTHGVVRASFDVLPGLGERLAVGLFEKPRSYPAWVRFGGPGPLRVTTHVVYHPSAVFVGGRPTEKAPTDRPGLRSIRGKQNA